jgi:hypothetical protein
MSFITDLSKCAGVVFLSMDPKLSHYHIQSNKKPEYFSTSRLIPKPVNIFNWDTIT